MQSGCQFLTAKAVVLLFQDLPVTSGEAAGNPLTKSSGTIQQGPGFPHTGPPCLTFFHSWLLGRVINFMHLLISHSCTMKGGLGFTPTSLAIDILLKAPTHFPIFCSCNYLHRTMMDRKSYQEQYIEERSKGVWWSHKCFNCNDRQVQSSH